MKILLVENDPLIAEALVKALVNQHYGVDVAADGQSGWELITSASYDLVLLNVVLPRLDGISLCRRLRSQGNRTPVLLFTAQDASVHEAIGLDAGADDYMAQPFDLQETVLRIRALLQRESTLLLLSWENLKLDPGTCEVTCNGRSLPLTPQEYSLLEIFLRNPHRIFSTSALIEHLWSVETPAEDTLRFHIKALRQKLVAAGAVGDPIESIYGIGYRLKPSSKQKQGSAEKQPEAAERSSVQNLPSETLPSEPLPSDVESQTIAGISAIWQQVETAIQQRVAVIEQALTLLLQNQLDEPWRQRAEQEAHKLAGSLGMFGLAEGSRLAQAIEPLFTSLPLNPNQTQRLSQLVAELRQELQRLNPEHLPELLSAELPSADAQISNQPWLLIVSANSSFAQQLSKEAPRWGLRSQTLSSPVAARAQLSNGLPDAALLDFTVADSLTNNLTLLAELTTCTPPVPTLVLTDRESLLDRVNIARLGGRRVLQQPVTATQVLESVNQVLQSSRRATARVMVVDDDRQILTALPQLLIPWGLHVSVLDNSLQFLEALESSTPDLLILDVAMPHISGIELCQVIRNEPRWSGLPILFLTAYTDADTMQQVFAAGADDYVRKPIVGPELVTRIFNRLERSRLLKNLAETDPLTGVANRCKSTQELTQFLEWCHHCQQPFCFAIVELHSLRTINQQYGHAATDTVLARFGELLRQTFHGEEIVGRWGGGEFVVGLPGMTRQDGIQRLNDLQKALNRFEFKAANGTRFQTDLRMGVVQYPHDGTELQMLYQAAQAILNLA